MFKNKNNNHCNSIDFKCKCKQVSIGVFECKETKTIYNCTTTVYCGTTTNNN